MNRWTIRIRPGDRVVIQIAAQLLVTPNLQHLVDRLDLWVQNGNRADQVHAAALVDGQISLHGCLIQCIIESSSESLSRGRR
jgi:hypothetical protein